MLHWGKILIKIIKIMQWSAIPNYRTTEASNLRFEFVLTFNTQGSGFVLSIININVVSAYTSINRVTLKEWQVKHSFLCWWFCRNCLKKCHEWAHTQIKYQTVQGLKDIISCVLACPLVVIHDIQGHKNTNGTWQEDIQKLEYLTNAVWKDMIRFTWKKIKTAVSNV